MVMNALIDTISSKVVEINILALDMLRASNFSNLFWTLVLTVSFNVAIPVLFIGCILGPIRSRH